MLNAPIGYKYDYDASDPQVIDFDMSFVPFRGTLFPEVELVAEGEIYPTDSYYQNPDDTDDDFFYTLYGYRPYMCYKYNYDLKRRKFALLKTFTPYPFDSSDYSYEPGEGWDDKAGTDEWPLFESWNGYLATDYFTRYNTETNAFRTDFWMNYSYYRRPWGSYASYEINSVECKQIICNLRSLKLDNSEAKLERNPDMYNYPLRIPVGLTTEEFDGIYMKFEMETFEETFRNDIDVEFYEVTRYLIVE